MQLKKHTTSNRLFWGVLSCIALFACLSCSYYRNPARHQRQSDDAITSMSNDMQDEVFIGRTDTHVDKEQYLSNSIKYRVKFMLKEMAANTDHYLTPFLFNASLNNIISSNTYIKRPAYYTFLFRYVLF